MLDISPEQAQAVHNKMLIADGHTDTLVLRVSRGEDPLEWKERDPAYDMDIPRMLAAGFDAGFFVVGNGTTADIRVTIERTLSQIEMYPTELQLVSLSADVEHARKTGKIGILMTIEGAAGWLEGNLDILRLYYRLGVRCVGITHGEGRDEQIYLQKTESPYGFCTYADRERERKNAGGLTNFGRDVLRMCNELGIVTDLSHANDRTFYETIEQSRLPVTMTHTGVFSLCPHWRCLTDDQIKTLANAGGVLGIAFAPFFIDAEHPTIDRIVEHICYVRDLVGIEHVAIGSDFDGLGDSTAVVGDVSQLVLLTQSMLAHGLSEPEVQQVWGGNFMRLLRETIDSSQTPQEV